MDYEELMSMYRESLREKRGMLARQWAQLRASPGGDEEVAALRRSLHHLAGSAGAYGFDLLGDNARHLEKSMGAWMSTPIAERCMPAVLARRHVGDFEELTEALELAIGTEQA